MALSNEALDQIVEIEYRKNELYVLSFELRALKLLISYKLYKEHRGEKVEFDDRDRESLAKKLQAKGFSEEREMLRVQSFVEGDDPYANSYEARRKIKAAH